MGSLDGRRHEDMFVIDLTTGARKMAIKYYETIASQYAGNPSPLFPNPPAPYPLLDEILYYLAYEYEQANDLTNARRVYYDLVTKTPT